MFMLPPIHSSSKDSRTNFFSPSILLSHVEAEVMEFSRFHRKKTASTASRPASASAFTSLVVTLTGEAIRCYTLPKGDLGATTAKRQLLYVSRHINPVAGCSFRLGVPKVVDRIMQGVDKHLGVKKGSTKNFKYMRSCLSSASP